MPQRTGRPPGVALDGPRVRRLREDLGLTSTEVAARVSYDPQSIRRAERSATISRVLAARIARVLGVEVKDIARAPELKEPAA